MAATRRRTAVLRIVSGDRRHGERALDVQREYRFDLELDGREVAAGTFRSPLGDETWRGAIASLREATTNRDAKAGALRRSKETVESVGVQLYGCLRQLAPELDRFLADRSRPRRLVLKSDCPEIHRLPWEAMLDDTTRPWQSPAEADLSIVRATDVFDDLPVAVQPTVTVRAIFGPDTPKRTLDALHTLAARAERRQNPRISVRIGDEGPGAYSGDIVHVEAHGDVAAGETEMGRRGYESTLTDLVRDRRMVLLWSCHSGFVHSWGESVAMALHRQGNAFVLAFATPLHLDASAEVAAGFYGTTFSGPDPVDPETAVVRERLRLYREHEPACEWAALMLWLRAPLDLSAVALDGPRILPAAGEIPAEALDRLSAVLGHEALPGRPVLVRSLALPAAVPAELVEAYRGMVAHLRADDPAGEMMPALEALALRPPSVHRADRFLAIFDRLASYPDSLLLWSGVGAREVEALGLLQEFPSSLAILLTSAFWVEAGPGIFASEVSPATPAQAPPTTWEPHDALAHLEWTMDSGQLDRAYTLWKGLQGQFAAESPEFLRLQIAGYWTLARLELVAEAERCAVDVKRLSTFEGLLLDSNLAHRRGRDDEARRDYVAAESLARDACDRARATLERAFLAHETGDRELAEHLFVDAIHLLEDTTDLATETRWTSALGRALRDYADLIAGRRERLAESARYLRRALMIHALDGRLNQVGAVLRTRGKIEHTAERWARSEDALVASAAVLFKCRNLGGWAVSMMHLAELAFERGHFHQALAVASATAEALKRGQGRRTLGRIALVAARSAWRLGRTEDAATWSAQAQNNLSRASDRIIACDFHDVLTSLRGWPE